MAKKGENKHLHTKHKVTLFTFWTSHHLVTPGQEASLGVPNCLNMRKSWSISESPGKSGCRFTCHQLNELTRQVSLKRLPSPQKYSPSSRCPLLRCRTWSQEESLVPWAICRNTVLCDLAVQNNMNMSHLYQRVTTSWV